MNTRFDSRTGTPWAGLVIVFSIFVGLFVAPILGVIQAPRKPIPITSLLTPVEPWLPVNISETTPFTVPAGCHLLVTTIVWGALVQGAGTGIVLATDAGILLVLPVSGDQTPAVNLYPGFIVPEGLTVSISDINPTVKSHALAKHYPTLAP